MLGITSIVFYTDNESALDDSYYLLSVIKFENAFSVSPLANASKYTATTSFTSINYEFNYLIK